MKLQRDEKIIHELRPEKKLLVIWIFTKGLSSFMLFALLIVLAGLNATDAIKSLKAFFGVAIIVPLVSIILSLAYYSLLRKTYVYYITNYRCVLSGGIFKKIEHSIPYHKITDVETSQNIAERILGISRLNIFTPGTGSMINSPWGGNKKKAEVTFEGLKDSDIPSITINENLRSVGSHE